MERGKARVQIWRSEKYGDKYCIYIPKAIIQLEKIQPGNTIDFTIENNHPEITCKRKVIKKENPAEEDANRIFS